MVGRVLEWSKGAERVIEWSQGSREGVKMELE